MQHALHVLPGLANSECCGLEASKSELKLLGEAQMKDSDGGKATEDLEGVELEFQNKVSTSLSSTSQQMVHVELPSSQIMVSHLENKMQVSDQGQFDVSSSDYRLLKQGDSLTIVDSGTKVPRIDNVNSSVASLVHSRTAEIPALDTSKILSAEGKSGNSCGTAIEGNLQKGKNVDPNNLANVKKALSTFKFSISDLSVADQ